MEYSTVERNATTGTIPVEMDATGAGLSSHGIANRTSVNRSGMICLLT